MNLLYQLPKSAEKLKDIKFCIPFNLDENINEVNGYCVVTKNKIHIYINDELKNEYNISDFSELECQQLIGCSVLVSKVDEQSQIICRFTQTYFIKYAELSKLIEFYKRTGEFITETDAEELICPKCGMPLCGSSTCPFCGKKSRIFMKLVKRIGPYKWLFALTILCTILTQLINLFIPYLQKIIVDDYVVPMNKDTNGFLTLCFANVGVLIVGWIFGFLNMRAGYKVALCVGRDLRVDVFKKAQDLSMSSISKRTAGELINRVSIDAMKLQEFIAYYGRDAIVNTFSFIIIAIMLIIMDLKLALLILLPTPFVMYISLKIFVKIGVYYGRFWRHSNRHSSVLHDILNGIRVVKSYGSEKREIENYAKTSLTATKAGEKAEVTWQLTFPLAWFLLCSGNFLVLYFGGKMVLNQTFSLGELIQYTSYVSMLFMPMRWMIELPRMLADTAVSANGVFEILEEVPDISNKENSVDLDIKGDITFDDVYFGYKVYNPVLKSISFNIKQGEMIGIVGHSGVGKSTMINLMLRLYDCTQGKILIDGVNIKDISQEALRSQIGVVLQETFLFDGSVYDNIKYAKPDATFEEIIQAAKIANAHDFIVRLPDGYNTRVGEKGFSLSGGERQRISIARAIIHNPKIIILDEATASLDTQTEKQIQEALGRLTKGRTTIAIAHRLSTLSNADRLIVLDKGKLAEIGSHEELMRKYGVYYKLVMAQRQTSTMKKTSSKKLESAN